MISFILATCVEIRTSSFFFSDLSPRSFNCVSTRLLLGLDEMSNKDEGGGDNATHMSLLINSSLVSTFDFASAWSCGTRTGPMSLYTVLFDVRDANSYSTLSTRRLHHNLIRSSRLFNRLVFLKLSVEFLACVDCGGEFELEGLVLLGCELEFVLEGCEGCGECCCHC